MTLVLTHSATRSPWPVRFIEPPRVEFRFSSRHDTLAPPNLARQDGAPRASYGVVGAVGPQAEGVLPAVVWAVPPGLLLRAAWEHGIALPRGNRRSEERRVG